MSANAITNTNDQNSGEEIPLNPVLDLVPDWHDNGAGFLRWANFLLPLGFLLSGFALVSGDAQTLHNFSQGYLLGYCFIWTVVIGSLFFIGLQYATSANWSVVVRRQAEMFASPVIPLAVLFVPIAIFVWWPSSFGLFPWAEEPATDLKAGFLNAPFMALRAALFFAVWIGFKYLFVDGSLRQDRGEGGVEATVKMRKWSYPFLVLFALSTTYAAFDWLMSLWPHWFSTIFGVYVFAGMFLTGLSCITLTVIGMRKRGMLGNGVVRKDHLYSLGALQFAFTCFWAYIGFSQFMLIWYAHLSEETIYFTERMKPGWLGVTILLPIVRFAIPFLLLLSRRAKTNPTILVPASWLILAGQLLDLYWMIVPDYHGYDVTPTFGWAELGPILFLIGMLLFFVGRFMNKHRAMAIGDPLLAKSREFHL